jgi:hypothetical protein
MSTPWALEPSLTFKEPLNTTIQFASPEEAAVRQLLGYRDEISLWRRTHAA